MLNRSDVKMACVQMTTARDPAENLAVIAARVKSAVAQGAQLVALPETCTYMEKSRTAMQTRLERQADSQVLAALQDLARSEAIYLLVGSMILADEKTDKAVNRCFLIGPDGAVEAQYDKIHMFDVELEDGERHNESATYQAGDRLVVSQMGDAATGVKLGLSICYDLRFPNLYRRLSEAEAEVIFVPSAFTKQTGEAHWHALLRARAIETGAFIVAPAQIGSHENGRETYGHSLIVNPWGRVIAEAGDDDGVIMGSLDLTMVARARRQIPSLQHGTDYTKPDGKPTQD
ncbi:MAG: carbon-nitrogen hydrolase family protein [Alphaproteobacteria bacterium]|nr:carbon-nitrogen hydrolase family protein [Alphaproteobacteria bacterium]